MNQNNPLLFLVFVFFSGTFDNGLGRRGIQIYPACGGSLAAGHVSDVLSGSSNYDDRAEHAIRSALAGGMCRESLCTVIEMSLHFCHCLKMVAALPLFRRPQQLGANGRVQT